MSLIASIEPAVLQVEPGGEGVLVLRVRNRGTIVDRFEIGIVGPAAEWAHAEPDALRLFPDTEGTARIIFRAPRASSPAADTYAFGISIRPAADPASMAVEEGRVTVGPFVELATEIVPQTSRGGRSGRHSVTVRNDGNTVAEVSAQASDPDRLLRFDVQPERFGLAPGASRRIQARVTPGATFFIGPPNRIPFVVQIDERLAGSREIPASFEQRALLPGWIKPAVGLAAAAVVALLFLPRLLGLTSQESATASPSPSGLVAAETAAPSATLDTFGAPTDSAAGQVNPTPVPTPGEVAVTVLGDTVELQGLTLRCPANDQACRDRVGQAVEIIVGGRLLGPYDGGGLFSADDLAPQTLPILARWQGPFPYQAVGGAETGTTSKVAIDLAPLLAVTPGVAYAVVEDSSGQTRRYVIPAETATALKDLLYEVPPAMEPDATPPPDPGLRDKVFNRDLVYRFDFFEATPSP